MTQQDDRSSSETFATDSDSEEMDDSVPSESDIFSFLKNTFSDVSFFDELVADKLKVMLSEKNRSILYSYKVANKIGARYFQRNLFKSPDPKTHKALREQWETIQLILKTGIILLVSKDKEALQDIELLESQKELFSLHSFLADELSPTKDQEELSYLLKFANYLRIAITVIPASSNKHLLLKLLERLEGSGIHYVTGGAMKPTCRRRLKLIELEGHAPPIKRRPRRTKRQMMEDEKKAIFASGGKPSKFRRTTGKNYKQKKDKDSSTESSDEDEQADDETGDDEEIPKQVTSEKVNEEKTNIDLSNLTSFLPPKLRRDESLYLNVPALSRDGSVLSIPGLSRSTSLNWDSVMSTNPTPRGRLTRENSNIRINFNNVDPTLDDAQRSDGNQDGGMMNLINAAEIHSQNANSAMGSTSSTGGPNGGGSISIRKPNFQRTHSLFTSDLKI